MKKLLLFLLLLPAWVAAQQTHPVSPVQKPQNSAYLDQATGGRWFFDGTSWYSVAPYSPPNTVLTGLSLTVSGSTLTVHTGTWRINSSVYSLASNTNFTLQARDSVLSRYEVVYATGANNGIGIKVGVASVRAVQPTVGTDTLFVGAVLITPTATTVIPPGPAGDFVFTHPLVQQADANPWTRTYRTDTLKIAGKYTLPSDDGLSGQVLQTDGNHNVFWSNQAIYLPGFGLHLVGQTFSVDTFKMVTNYAMMDTLKRNAAHFNPTQFTISNDTISLLSSFGTIHTGSGLSGDGSSPSPVILGGSPIAAATQIDLGSAQFPLGLGDFGFSSSHPTTSIILTPDVSTPLIHIETTNSGGTKQNFLDLGLGATNALQLQHYDGSLNSGISFTDTTSTVFGKNLTANSTIDTATMSANPNEYVTAKWVRIHGGGSGSTAQSLTFNNGGSGAASGTTFNGGTAKTISYNTIGASPLAGSSSITTVGTLIAGSIPYSLLTGTPSGLPPTGTAGGELAGTYPNPTLLNSAVISKVLTGYSSGAGTVLATDNILQAFQKINGNVATNTTNIATNTTSITAKANSLVPTAVKTANYTAAVNDFVPVNTTSGNITITLPTAPADKSVIAVKHVIRGGTNTVTLQAGGSDVFNVSGGANTGTITLLNQGTILQYNASGAIWYSLATDLALSQLDLRYAAIGAAGTPGGSNTQVQFNNSGAFGGDSKLIWNNTAKSLYVGNVPAPAALTGSAVGTGDSFMSGTGAIPSTLKFFTQFTTAMGLTPINVGVPGLNLGAGGGSCFVNNLSTYIPTNPGSYKYLFICIGQNDINGPATYTEANFASDWVTAMNYALAHGWTGNQIILTNIAWNPATTASTFTAPQYAARQIAFSACVDSIATVYGAYDVKLFQMVKNAGGIGLLAPDFQHPNTLGHTMIAKAAYNAIYPHLAQNGNTFEADGLSQVNQFSLPKIGLLPNQTTQPPMLLAITAGDTVGRITQLPKGIGTAGNFNVNGQISNTMASIPTGLTLDAYDILLKYNQARVITAYDTDPTYYNYIEPGDAGMNMNFHVSHNNVFQFFNNLSTLSLTIAANSELQATAGLQLTSLGNKIYSASGGYNGGIKPLLGDAETVLFNELSGGRITMYGSNGTNGGSVPMFMMSNDGSILIQNNLTLTSPIASARLAVQSTTQGFLPPVMSTTQQNAISSPTEGLVVYDNVLHSLAVRTNSAWVDLGSGGGFANPMSAAGDLIYGGVAGTGTRLAASTGTTVLHSGTTPSWSAVSLTADVSGILPVANGGTGTSSPGIVAGTNVTVSGTWPNQTINSSTASAAGSNTQLQYNNSGAFGGSASLTFSAAKLVVGVASTTTGTIGIANSSLATVPNISTRGSGLIFDVDGTGGKNMYMDNTNSGTFTANVGAFTSSVSTGAMTVVSGGSQTSFGVGRFHIDNVTGTAEWYIGEGNGSSLVTKDWSIYNNGATSAIGFAIKAANNDVLISTSTDDTKNKLQVNGSVLMGIPTEKPTTTTAINSTATVTAAQLATGVLTSTSAAAVTMTLTTATLMATQLGAAQGTHFHFTVDNTAGANTVTVALGSGMTQLTVGPSSLTIPSGTTGVGVFDLYFSSTTACTISRIE